MDKHEASELIENRLCDEIILVAETIKKNNAMSIQDLEKLDKLYHTMKDKYTTEAMIEAQEYEHGMSGAHEGPNQNGNSGYRGRGMNGRFVSRDSSYAQGYNDAMRRMSGANSYDSMMPYYDEPRRW